MPQLSLQKNNIPILIPTHTAHGIVGSPAVRGCNDLEARCTQSILKMQARFDYVMTGIAERLSLAHLHMAWDQRCTIVPIEHLPPLAIVRISTVRYSPLS